MQIPAVLRELVTFVRTTTADGKQWVGTGFFVNEEVVDGLWAGYIVTCGHCIAPLEAETPVTSISLRLNLRSGGSAEIETEVANWERHPSSDVAMYALMPDQSIFDYKHFPARPGASKEFRDEKRIDSGDDIFMTGRLIYHPGATRMLPIVRVGSIAAFPEDPVRLATGEENVILIETRSLGGLSGSPVFVHFGDWRRDENGNLGVLPNPEPGSQWDGGPNYLLGVMHGFYPTKGNDPDGIGDATKEPLNTGIGVVIPVERIHDLIETPRFKEQREMAKKQEADNVMPIPTSGSATAGQDKTADLMSKLLQVPKDEPED